MDYFHLHKKLPLSFDLLIPFLKFNQELVSELLVKKINIIFQNEKVIICENLKDKPIWSQDWWPNCKSIPYTTKNEALRILKSQKNLGVYYNTAQSALAKNLRSELRELPVKRLDFKVPHHFNFKYFTWTLLEPNHLLICDTPFSRFPLGWHEFNENKTIPPNRAYLKLWEILSLSHIQLNKKARVLDLGSSPGGWSWTLSEFANHVYSVDKAPLNPKIAQIKNIEYFSEDAFKLKPENLTDYDWLFSDIICTPERLLELVTAWQNNSSIKNYVCTIKFKGSCDFNILNTFLKFEHSKIIHLYQNKNEVTWIKQVPYE